MEEGVVTSPVEEGWPPRRWKREGGWPPRRWKEEGVAAARPRSDGSASGCGWRVWDKDGRPRLEIGLVFFHVRSFSVRVRSFSVSFEKTDRIMSIFLCVLTRTEK